MELSTVHVFAGDPIAVHSVLTDEAVLAEVCRATGATHYRVASDGRRTAVTRTMPSPSAVTKFVGEQLTIDETTEWGEPQGDGSRRGSIQATVAGLPVTLKGDLNLSPTTTGSKLTYTGSFTIAIPMIGRILEQQAAPALTDALVVQERVANQHLAG